MREYRYVIIGGTTRAATTSLFVYFNDHPAVCASNIKETRFFLDSDYPLPVKYRLEDGLDKYEKYFNHCRNLSLRLEVTPDYLYSSGTPQKIKKCLSDVKLIFILREPIDRLISWYRFAKQNARLPAQMSFDEYIYLQLQGSGQDRSTEQHMRALEQGRYSTYLKKYLDLFEHDRLFIMQYKLLEDDPTRLLTEICLFIGIDPALYQKYRFRTFNSSQAMKSSNLHHVYVKLIQSLQMRVHDKKEIRVILRYLRRRFEPLYLRLNRCRNEQTVISDSVRKLLNDYYRDEPAALASLLGWEKFSWEASEKMFFREHAHQEWVR